MANTRANKHGRGINRYPMNPPLTSAMRARVESKMEPPGHHDYDQGGAIYDMGRHDYSGPEHRQYMCNPEGDY
jgi:hypothetical protein